MNENNKKREKKINPDKILKSLHIREKIYLLPKLEEAIIEYETNFDKQEQTKLILIANKMYHWINFYNTGKYKDKDWKHNDFTEQLTKCYNRQNKENEKKEIIEKYDKNDVLNSKLEELLHKQQLLNHLEIEMEIIYNDSIVEKYENLENEILVLENEIDKIKNKNVSKINTDNNQKKNKELFDLENKYKSNISLNEKDKNQVKLIIDILTKYNDDDKYLNDMDKKISVRYFYKTILQDPSTNDDKILGKLFSILNQCKIFVEKHLKDMIKKLHLLKKDKFKEEFKRIKKIADTYATLEEENNNKEFLENFKKNIKFFCNDKNITDVLNEYKRNEELYDYIELECNVYNNIHKNKNDLSYDIGRRMNNKLNIIINKLEATESKNSKYKRQDNLFNTTNLNKANGNLFMEFFTQANKFYDYAKKWENDYNVDMKIFINEFDNTIMYNISEMFKNFINALKYIRRNNDIIINNTNEKIEENEFEENNSLILDDQDILLQLHKYIIDNKVQESGFQEKKIKKYKNKNFISLRSYHPSDYFPYPIFNNNNITEYQSLNLLHMILEELIYNNLNSEFIEFIFSKLLLFFVKYKYLYIDKNDEYDAVESLTYLEFISNNDDLDNSKYLLINYFNIITKLDNKIKKLGIKISYQNNLDTFIKYYNNWMKDEISNGEDNELSTKNGFDLIKDLPDKLQDIVLNGGIIDKEDEMIDIETKDESLEYLDIEENQNLNITDEFIEETSDGFEELFNNDVILIEDRENDTEDNDVLSIFYNGFTTEVNHVPKLKNGFNELKCEKYSLISQIDTLRLVLFEKIRKIKNEDLKKLIMCSITHCQNINKKCENGECCSHIFNKMRNAKKNFTDLITSWKILALKQKCNIIDNDFSILLELFTCSVRKCKTDKFDKYIIDLFIEKHDLIILPKELFLENNLKKLGKFTILQIYKQYKNYIQEYKNINKNIECEKDKLLNIGKVNKKNVKISTINLIKLWSQTFKSIDKSKTLDEIKSLSSKSNIRYASEVDHVDNLLNNEIKKYVNKKIIKIKDLGIEDYEIIYDNEFSDIYDNDFDVREFNQIKKNMTNSTRAELKKIKNHGGNIQLKEYEKELSDIKMKGAFDLLSTQVMKYIDILKKVSGIEHISHDFFTQIRELYFIYYKSGLKMKIFNEVAQNLFTNYTDTYKFEIKNKLENDIIKLLIYIHFIITFSHKFNLKKLCNRDLYRQYDIESLENKGVFIPELNQNGVVIEHFDEQIKVKILLTGYIHELHENDVELLIDYVGKKVKVINGIWNGNIGKIVHQNNFRDVGDKIIILVKINEGIPFQKIIKLNINNIEIIEDIKEEKVSVITDKKSDISLYTLVNCIITNVGFLIGSFNFKNNYNNVKHSNKLYEYALKIYNEYKKKGLIKYNEFINLNKSNMENEINEEMEKEKNVLKKYDGKIFTDENKKEVYSTFKSDMNKQYIFVPNILLLKNNKLEDDKIHDIEKLTKKNINDDRKLNIRSGRMQFKKFEKILNKYGNSTLQHKKCNILHKLLQEHDSNNDISYDNISNSFDMSSSFNNDYDYDSNELSKSFSFISNS